jgi:hypothetical protein
MQPALGLGMLWSGRYQGFTPPSRCALRRAHTFALECILVEDGGDTGPSVPVRSLGIIARTGRVPEFG